MRRGSVILLAAIMKAIQTIAFFLLSYVICTAGGINADDAKVLLRHTPDYQRAKRRGGCPEIEMLWADKRAAALQIRNECPKKGIGAIGQYSVDLSTGDIWRGIEREQKISSPELRRWQRKLLNEARSKNPRR